MSPHSSVIVQIAQTGLLILTNCFLEVYRGIIIVSKGTRIKERMISMNNYKNLLANVVLEVVHSSLAEGVTDITQLQEDIETWLYVRFSVDVEVNMTYDNGEITINVEDEYTGLNLTTAYHCNIE